MSLSLGLDVKQVQSLGLTPQLLQAIKMLQYSQHELVDAVAKEVSQNPFLDYTETKAGPGQTAGDHGTPDGLQGFTNAKTAARNQAIQEEGYTTSAQLNSASSLKVRNNRPSSQTVSSPDDSIAQLSVVPDIRDRIFSQLSLLVASSYMRELAKSLVHCLDDDGYLREDDEKLAGLLNADIRDIERARAMIQSCDPPGIAARDLQECLTLQLKSKNRFDPWMEKLLNNLDLLAKADFNTLQRQIGLEQDEIEAMVAELRSLDPRPGLEPGEGVAQTITPDLFVYKDPKGRWHIEHNSMILPKITINEDYLAEIKNISSDAETKSFVQDRVQSATWLQKALEQRTRTILKVAKAILKEQLAFLEHGPAKIKPLVLKKIAEATGLHESTVSRATSEKYIETPHGTFSLKYFFTTALNAGEANHSAEAVRLLIKKMIQEETVKTVLSDDQIVKQLKEQDIVIARRTVAKYREAMMIPSSVHRKRLKKIASGT